MYHLKSITQRAGLIFAVAIAIGCSTSPQTFVDPELGLRLSFQASWRLDAESGTTLNDGSGRTITLERDGYIFKVMAQNKPKNASPCAGPLRQETVDQYRKLKIDGVPVWRAEAEKGMVNGYNDSQLSVVDIISPTELYAEPDSNGVIGAYNCALEFGNRIVRISYELPVSVDDLRAGRYKPDRLQEMDTLLESITWQ